MHIYLTSLSILPILVIPSHGLPQVPSSPNAHIPQHEDLPSIPCTSDQHIKRVTLSTIPIAVPPMSIDNGMIEHFDPFTILPCRDCHIARMSSDIHYLDGTTATPDTGMWLHHAIYVNRGYEDPTCGPGAWGQRFYATGNERTVIDMSSTSSDGTPIPGYHIAPHDQIALSVELMNMTPDWKTIIFSTTYDITTPTNHRHQPHSPTVEPVWLDVGTCTDSGVPATPNAVFEYTSPAPWTSPFHGTVFFAAGHLHDGGTSLEISKNGDVVCETLPTYEAVSSSEEDDSALKLGQEHIKSISRCHDLTRTRPGDRWSITAKYNTSAHAPMENMDGTLEPVMGIALMYIARDLENTSPLLTPEHRAWWWKGDLLPLVFAVVLLGCLVAVHGYLRREGLREGQIRLGRWSGSVRREGGLEKS